MKYLDIPEQLFREFGRKIGKGQHYSHQDTLNGIELDTWTLIEIDPHKHFSGADVVGLIGWLTRSDDRYQIFAIREYRRGVPEGSIGSISRPENLLIITAQIRFSLRDPSGSNYENEAIEASFTEGRATEVNHYLMPLMCDVLRLTHELTQDSTNEKSWQFWENSP